MGISSPPAKVGAQPSAHTTYSSSHIFLDVHRDFLLSPVIKSVQSQRPWILPCAAKGQDKQEESTSPLPPF
jgi:hypothetical protein